MRRNQWTILALLLAWWTVTLVRMRSSALHAGGSVATSGARGAAGDLRTYVIMTAVELGVVLLLLRPWSYRRSWGRAFVTAVLLLPWSFVWLMLLAHSGGVKGLHFLWLFGLLVGCLALTAISAAFALRRRSTTAERVSE